MSLNRLSASLRVRGISAPAHLVLAWLSDFENSENGRCNPSIATLCKATEMSPSSVRRALKELVDKHIVRRIKNFNAMKSQVSNSYAFEFDNLHVKDKCDKGGGCHFREGEGVKNGRGEGVKNDTQTSNIEPVNRTSNSLALAGPSPKVPAGQREAARARARDEFFEKFPYPEKLIDLLREQGRTHVANRELFIERFYQIKANGGLDANGKPIKSLFAYFKRMAKKQVPDEDTLEDKRIADYIAERVRQQEEFFDKYEAMPYSDYDV